MRNGVLVSLSLLVMLTPAPYPPLTVPFQRAGLSEIATAAIAVVVSLETLLIFELFRQRGRLLLRMDTIEQRFAAGGLTAHSAQPQAQGLDVGARAPSFVLRTPSDKPVDLAMLMERGKPLLLVFSDPGCGSCVALLRDVKVWQRRLAGQLTIAVVTRRTVGNESAAALHDLQDVLLQDGNEISQSYGVAGTPAAVLVRPDGTIGCPVSFGKAAIEALLPPPSTLVLEPSGGLTRVVAV